MVQTLANLDKHLRAIGGSKGVKKTCQSYFVELLIVVSLLFTEYKIKLGSKNMTNSIFWVLTFTKEIEG